MSISRKTLKRKFMQPNRILVMKDGVKLRCSSFFLDSGAHSLYTIKVYHKYGNKKDPNRYEYYETKEFWQYVDDYCDFLIKNKLGIDKYVTVDAIFNPEISWKVLKYMESRGLHPVPVLHYDTPMKWFDKHMECGYKTLGIGGSGQATKANYNKWADRVFSYLCPKSNDYLPLVKTHGFAVTAYHLLIRYPWFSVDSASWAKAAGFGSIYVPHKRSGKFDFSHVPYSIGLSYRSEAAKAPTGHFSTLSRQEKAVVLEWLELIDMPLGKMAHGDEIAEYGVFSQYHARATANLRFFEKLMEWLPKYPWAFRVKQKHTFQWGNV